MNMPGKDIGNDGPSFDKSNETYEIEVASPLLRPGLTVRVIGVSDRYLVKVMKKLMDMVREFNVST